MAYIVQRYFYIPGGPNKPRFFSQHNTVEECYAEIDFWIDAIEGGQHYTWQVVEKATGKLVPNPHFRSRLGQ